MPDCKDANQTLKFVAVAQLGTLAAMLAYFLMIQKEYAAAAKRYANLSQASVDTTQQFQALCASKTSLDKYATYRTHHQVVFYTIVASFILNVLFIAFAFHLPNNALVATSFLVFAAGAVAMGISAAAFSTIKNDLRNEPPECRQLFRNLYNLFLVGIIIGATQVAVAGYAGYSGYSTTFKRRY